MWITTIFRSFPHVFALEKMFMSDFQKSEGNLKEDFRFDRLKNAVEKAGGNAQVAGACGIAVSTLSSYMNGAEWKLSVARKIAAACNVSLPWLLFGNDLAERHSPPMPNSRPTAHIIEVCKPSNDVKVPFYDEAEASAGFGLLGPDTPAPLMVSISKDFLEKLGLPSHHTIMLKVRGDSMEPTLKTGDTIILNTSPSRSLSGVTVFVSSGQLMVKRLAPTATGTVRIISDNDRYPTEEAEISRFRWGHPDGDDAITIIGRVAYRLQAMS